MSAPSVHFIAIDLHLMRSNNRDEVVRAQDLLHRVQSKLDGALALWIRTETHLSGIAIVHRVRPEQIAQETFERRLYEPIHIFNISLSAQFRRDTAMHAKIISIDICSDWHCLETLDKQFVDLLIVELLQYL